MTHGEADTIRVCEVSEFGGPDVLRLAERAWPRPGPTEVVVRIEAATVNPSDLAARSGAHRHRLPDLRAPFVLGWDLAGVVAEVGTGVSAYRVGDPALGLIPWIHIAGRVGAYAQAAAVDADWLAPRPEGLDAIAGATVPLGALTARQALDLIAAPPGATILVTGASGAVGGFAVQMAVNDGLRVVALASTDDEEWVRGLGAEQVLPRGADLSTLHPVDAVFDAIPLGPEAIGSLRGGGVAAFTRRGRDVRIETPLVHPDGRMLAELAPEGGGGSPSHTGQPRCGSR